MSKSQTPQPVRGMQSLLGQDADRFHAVIAAFDRVRRLYGFRRVEVPILEPTAVFARTMGETTDVPPTASPPSMRKARNAAQFHANALPSEETK